MIKRIPLIHGFFGLPANPANRVFQTRRALGNRPDAWNRSRTETRRRSPIKLFDLSVEQYRRLEDDLPAMLGRFRKEIAAPSKNGMERHHQLFANRINRRIGHLRKKLLEVGVEKPRPKR